MPDLTVSRKQRLRTLENEIRTGMEEFYYTGLKLKEIRDDELYKEDGFDTFEAYCKDRWDWSKSRASQVITASEYRAKIPEFTNGKQGDDAPQWSERSVRELTRLEDKRDAAKVAAKVVKAVEQSEKQAAKDSDVKPMKLTASTVRKFVDEELGVDRAAKARETRRREEEESGFDLLSYLTDMTGGIEAKTQHLKSVDDDAWKLFRARNPKTIKRLIAASDALTELLRSVDG